MKTVNVKLLKPHRHARRDHLPGDVIELAEDVASWLVSLLVAELVEKISDKIKDLTHKDEEA